MVEIVSVSSTDLFTGTERHPLQVQRVRLLSSCDSGPVTVRVDGDGVRTPEPVVTELVPGEEHEVEVSCAVDAAHAEGDRVTVTVVAESAGRRAHRTAELTVAAPGWTMFMVPHFHYDPFWWNTQAGYLSTWDDQPQVAQDARKPGQAAAFDLVRIHLDEARRDPDYKFVLAELDYFKPYWDVHPEDRAELRGLLAAGRLELVGGMYNEPNTNLTSLESTIRNIILGFGFQRHVFGAAPRTGWMLDVFGHDPSFPSMLADAGFAENSFARGPFHLWGPEITTGDADGMQFASEFEWIGPDGRGLLSNYLAHHYTGGWRLNEVDTLEEAEAEAYQRFQSLKKVAATRNVLLPVGYNHVVPARWTTEIHRDWNRRYVWPRFVCGLPGEFFARVRADAAERRISFSPQSRDMNPVYPGKDVSYIDVKQAQRAGETVLVEAEKLATLASLLGARYPAEALDKAWRQLCFGAHHDGITGTESDQVYLDLLGGWREAHELGAAVRGEACAHLAERVDTRGQGEPLVVVNVQSWQRDDLASSTVDFPCPGPAGVTVLDDTGRAVPTTVTATTRHEDGTLASATLSFVATGVPATGYRTFRVVGTAEPEDSGWRAVAGHRAENDVFLVEADPSRGGALSRVLDKRSGKELLRAGEVAGGLVADDEYSAHPKFGKGPWHIVPTGTRTSTSDGTASVRVETSPAGQRIVSTRRLDELRITTEVLLWHGLDRLEFRTHVDGSIGQDRLLRVRFPLDVAGARPVYEVGNAVVGRTFGYTEVDTADHPFVLDSPAYFWAGVSSAARVELHDAGVPARRHAIGVAEIVAPESAALRDLVAALAQQGVTATTSRPDGSRCGTLRLDSNLPDVRLSIGGPAENAFTARVLAAAGEQYTAHLTEQLARNGTARVWVPANRTRATTWVPGADLRGERDLPVLVIAGEDGPATAIADLVADLTDATIAVDQPAGLDHTPAGEDLEDYSAALLNRGTPGMVVEPDGTLLLSLMRSCSEWPSGTWIDPPRRTAPDGSSFALQHWSHTFEYAVVCGAGDWRDAGFVRAGHGYNSRLLAHRADNHDGDLPSSASLLRVEPENVVLTALKARGNPLAAGQPSTVDGGITVRCYETHGVATEARVTCFLPLHDGAGTDLHEQPHTPLDTTGGVLRLALGPAATATATAVPKAPSPPEGRPLGPHEEPVQPVFARYWLHNKGPAPLGHLPAQVYLAPNFVDLSGPTTVQVTVSATAHAAGRVELVAPPGVTVTAREDLSFDLDGDHRRFEALLRPEPGAVPGIRHLAARIRVGEGQTIEDVTTVRIGDVDHEHRLGVDTETPALAVSPGVPAELRVRLTNHTVDEVRGEAQLISPFGTWEFVRPWTSGFTVPPGGDTVLTYQFDVPDGARSSATWAIVKVMAFGETHYTSSIPLVIKA